MALASGNSSKPLADPTTTTTASTTTAGATAPSSFVGIQPVRVLDTRNVTGGPVGVPAAGPIKANTSIDVKVTGIDNIPVDATSVAINVTIDQDATTKSFLTVWPTGQPRPLTSANNAEPGLVSPNSAIFQVGAGGMLSVYNQLGAVNVVIDVTGYFLPASGGGTTTTSTTAPTTTSSTTTTTTTVA
jgi:hypothetical protein